MAVTCRDKWTECLEHGGQVDVIYTDLEKAFDKIPHRRLISKLHSSCIHNYIVEWLEAFLSNRKQRVRIGNTFSNWAAVISYKNPPSNTGVIVENQVACIYGCHAVYIVCSRLFGYISLALALALGLVITH